MLGIWEKKNLRGCINDKLRGTLRDQESAQVLKQKKKAEVET